MDVFDGSLGGRLNVAPPTTGCCGGTVECEVTAGFGCEFKIGTANKYAARNTSRKRSRKVLPWDNSPCKPVFSPPVALRGAR